jgi:hypothetical protein
MHSSTIYTMGTALNRAQQNGITVEVLVGSEWLTGLVVAIDGHGVLLETDAFEHAVVRMESIDAVRIHASAPAEMHIPSQMARV